MVDSKLQSFKVGDKQAPKVKGGKAERQMPQAMSPTQTVGFSRIEALLDDEEPAAVGKKLSDMLDAIAEYEMAGKGPKQKSQAKRAKTAVERTIDLLDYLYRTKEALQAPVAKKGKDGNGK